MGEVNSENNLTTNLNEKRAYKREPYAQPIKFLVNIYEVYEVKKVTAEGIGVDISNGGIGFITECPLEPGHVLRFLVTDENPLIADGGLVKWAVSNGSSTRVGVQFKGILNNN